MTLGLNILVVTLDGHVMLSTHGQEMHQLVAVSFYMFSNFPLFLLIFNIIQVRHQENMILLHRNNKGTKQHVYPHIVVIVFVVSSLVKSEDHLIWINTVLDSAYRVHVNQQNHTIWLTEIRS